ncbi:hypothetical protein [Kingella denitrificans]|uniref:hypothetical protein n=1 Tax=Kingella denitrificans TaxID=502 RepID=UPI0028D6D105|nr:hypothetical protein [Kingella denitrificans]
MTMIQVKSNAVQAAFERTGKPINMAVPYMKKQPALWSIRFQTTVQAAFRPLLPQNSLYNPQQSSFFGKAAG